METNVVNISKKEIKGYNKGILKPVTEVSAHRDNNSVYELEEEKNGLDGSTFAIDIEHNLQELHSEEDKDKFEEPTLIEESGRIGDV